MESCCQLFLLIDSCFFFFFNDPATTEIYPLPLHDALPICRELIAELDDAMADLDLVMTAAAPSEAPLIDKVPKFTIMNPPSLTIAFNVTGSPAMSVCCGYTDAGLPLSFQIVGKRFEDATVLRAAHAYEQATPWRQRRPQL